MLKKVLQQVYIYYFKELEGGGGSGGGDLVIKLIKVYFFKKKIKIGMGEEGMVIGEKERSRIEKHFTLFFGK